MEYMFFSSDILDQFVKRDLFFTERGRNLFVSDLLPSRLIFFPGKNNIGLVTINKTAFYSLGFLNGEVFHGTFL